MNLVPISPTPSPAELIDTWTLVSHEVVGDDVMLQEGLRRVERNLAVVACFELSGDCFP
jgi:hypothetical protein